MKINLPIFPSISKLLIQIEVEDYKIIAKKILIKESTALMEEPNTNLHLKLDQLQMHLAQKRIIG